MVWLVASAWMAVVGAGLALLAGPSNDACRAE